MNPSLTLILLPYAVSILFRLPSLILEHKLMESSLEDLANLPKPPQEAFNLTADQRINLVKHLRYASLKSSTVLSSLNSLFAAFIILTANHAPPVMLWILLVFLVLTVASISWVLPKKLYYFVEISPLRIQNGMLLVLLLCASDIFLAWLSVASLRYAPASVTP